MYIIYERMKHLSLKVALKLSGICLVKTNLGDGILEKELKIGHMHEV